MDDGVGIEVSRLSAREAVLAAAASGKTLKDYCQGMGLSYDAIRSWRKRYAAELGLALHSALREAH